MTGPPGSGKSEAALAKIREAATVAGPRGRAAAGGGAALLVLPTYGEAQHALRSALARWDARGLFDAPFVTFTSAGERFLPGFRVRSLPSTEERDRLLERALEAADVPAFREARVHRGFRAKLLRLLKDAKQGALAPQAALAALAERATRLPAAPRERLEGFLAVTASYTRLLEAADLEDHEDALQRLRVALEAGAPPSTPALLVVDGFDDMTPVEEAILLALARHIAMRGGEVLVTLPFEAARAELFASAAGLRARLLGAGFVEQRLTGFVRAPGGALERLALGYGGAGGQPVAAGEQIELLLALDADDEDDSVAREVRRLLDEGGAGFPGALFRGAGLPGAPLRGARDVLLVLPDLEGRGPGLERALARLGVPTQLGGPRPLSAEPWVRAAEAPLALLAGRVAAGELAPERVLDTLRYRALCGDARVPLAALDAQEMIWRQQGYPGDWAQLSGEAAPTLRPLLEAWEQERRRLAAVGSDPARHLLAALDALVPLPAPGGLAADGTPRDPAHDRALAAALDARARVAALARARIEAAERVGAVGDGPAAAADLLEALEGAAFEPRERRLDVVHLLGPEAARGWEAAVVFVVGLEESSLPRRSQEDPLLADAERALLGGEGLALPTSAEHEARERRRILALLTRARRRLVLSRPTLTPEGDELPPSRVLLEVERLVTLVPRPRSARVAPGAPASAACRTPEELTRFAAARLARPSKAPDEVPLARALLARLDGGLLARAARWRRGAADPLPLEALERFRASVELVSPSGLNSAHSCAQRHFLERVVGIREDDAPITGPVFGARELGRAVHAALDRALRQPDEAATTCAEAVLAAEPVVGLDRGVAIAEIARVVTLFRAREADIVGDFVPELPWLEGALGGARGYVTLGAGLEPFRLRGRVDRVDVAPALAQAGPGAARRALVVDYKLGGETPRLRQAETLKGGDLQLPLYARALEVAHGFEVVGLEWMSTLARARRQLLSEQAGAQAAARSEGPKAKVLEPAVFRALIEEAERTAADLVARLRTGDHALAPFDADTCDACPMRGPCRPERLAVARATARRAHLPGPEGGQ